MQPTLVVMAAGMGSRFGGAKQMEPISEHGEALLDFSVYDALRAGFGKIVIVIKKAIEADFEEAVGARLRRQADVVYAYQELTDLPGGRVPPEGRVKPWGTGQAVLAARRAVGDVPFAVINADDFYGRDAFAVMAEFLSDSPTGYAMVGYRLGNTLSEHGSVARGVCSTENGFLTALTERTKIVKTPDGAAYTEDGETWVPLPLDTIVSMQLFGFLPDFFGHLETGFETFLRNNPDPLKGEFFLPKRVGELISQGQATLRVLESADKWFGVTYREDKPAVVAAIAALRAGGAYPDGQLTMSR
ncbi:MAG: NTP transferase domain-containing protein [Oscillospiraceae bacterium]|jgi:NDP-sugar pyrophosphorylase family protein|nr:NTP transferase domain-containing protein [Oscillospiraceae bacterium]